MRFGYREECLDHETGPRHPESADRLEAIRRRLSRHHGVEYEAGGLVDVGALERVHDPEYVADVEAFCADGGGTWDADTLGTESTWAAARPSAAAPNTPDRVGALASMATSARTSFYATVP